MNRYEFLKIWESYSGLKLIGEEREQFLKECDLILYLDDDILEMALKVASQKRNFELQYIETVSLHLRQYLHRVRYEALDGKGESAAKKIPRRHGSRKKKHLSLIFGGRTS